mmetsp:Transcript_6504/g.19239  ORF Transcript_6504/g.19239 Transcript_6504/m.19239 type:complete len:225 (-) Transcript_6504:1800-2474(-)
MLLLLLLLLRRRRVTAFDGLVELHVEGKAVQLAENVWVQGLDGVQDGLELLDVVGVDATLDGPHQAGADFGLHAAQKREGAEQLAGVVAREALHRLQEVSLVPLCQDGSPVEPSRAPDAQGPHHVDEGLGVEVPVEVPHARLVHGLKDLWPNFRGLLREAPEREGDVMQGELPLPGQAKSLELVRQRRRDPVLELAAAPQEGGHVLLAEGVQLAVHLVEQTLHE